MEEKELDIDIYYYMTQPVHILTQMGILTAFSISKKITTDEVNKFLKKHKKSGKTEEEIGEMLRNKIFDEIKSAIENQKIPGLIGPINSTSIHNLNETTIPNINDINKLVTIVATKMMEKKYDKLSLCYFINYMVNILGLTEKDFEKFHKKMSSQNKDPDDEEDEDEDD